MFGDYHLTVNGQRLPNTRDGLQLHARAQVVSSAILMGILLPGILVMSSFSWHQLKEQIVPLLWVTAAFFGHSLLDFAVARVRTGRPEHIGSLASTPMIRSLTMLFLLFLVVPALMLMDSRWYWIPLLVLMALVTAVDILLFALKRFTDTELNNLKNGEEP